MQITTIELDDEVFNVKRLTGFSLLNAVTLNGKLGDMYRDLITAAIVDDKGKPMFSQKEVEKMDTATFSKLGGAVMELHKDEFESFRASAELKIKQKQN